MKKLFLFLLLSATLGLAQPTIDHSLSHNNLPTATSLTGTESYLIIQSGVGKKVSTALVSGIFQPFDSDLNAISL